MQGVFINGDRPPFKKTLKEAITTGGLASVTIEATSLHGGDYDGPLDQAPAGRIDIVGPDPHRKRDWYANIDIVGEPGAPNRKVTIR